jgi:hypothetical protein
MTSTSAAKAEMRAAYRRPKGLLHPVILLFRARDSAVSALIDLPVSFRIILPAEITEKTRMAAALPIS